MDNTAQSIKASSKRVMAWAKKNPAIAILLVGGVILLAIVSRRRGVSQLASDDNFGISEGGLGELGGTGIGEYAGDPLQGILTPPPAEDPITEYYYPEYEDWTVPSGTVYPEYDDQWYEYEIEPSPRHRPRVTERPTVAERTSWFDDVRARASERRTSPTPSTAPSRRERPKPKRRDKTGISKAISTASTGVTQPSARRRKKTTTREVATTPSRRVSLLDRRLSRVRDVAIAPSRRRSSNRSSSRA